MLKKLAVKTLDTEHLDITNLDAIREVVKRKKVDAIANCAAWTNVAVEDPEKYTLVEIECYSTGEPCQIHERG